MTIDREKSLSENLAELGCTHRLSKLYGSREIVREDGTIICPFDAKAAWEELCKRPQFCRQAEP